MIDVLIKTRWRMQYCIVWNVETNAVMWACITCNIRRDRAVKNITVEITVVTEWGVWKSETPLDNEGCSDMLDPSWFKGDQYPCMYHSIKRVSTVESICSTYRCNVETITIGVVVLGCYYSLLLFVVVDDRVEVLKYTQLCPYTKPQINLVSYQITNGVTR